MTDKIDTRKAELSFSLVRLLIWMSLLILVYFSPAINDLQLLEDPFLSLIVFALIYSLLFQIIWLARPLFDRFDKVFGAITIVLDLIAFTWLIYISGTFGSVFSALLLIVFIHAFLYWRLAGYILAWIVSLIAFSVIGFIELWADELWIVLGIHAGLFLLIGFSIKTLSTPKETTSASYKYFDDAVVKDPLTGLYNHRSFHNTMQKLIDNGRTITVILIDIDHFNEINKNYGFMTGDHALTAFGHTLRSSISREDGYAFRYGGEDFALISFETNENKLNKKIEYLNNVFQTNLDSIEALEGEKITLSYGIASREEGETKEALLERASYYLAKAKARGRNQSVINEKVEQ